MRSLCSLLRSAACGRSFSSSCADFSALKEPAEYFFHPDVQAKLKKLTGRDYGRIFQPKKLGRKLTSPKYELMTRAQLKQAMEESEVKADAKLQMPPLMGERKPISEVLSEDPELQGHDVYKYVFVDISTGVPERKRLVAVRDPNGTLRKGTWEERERMLQIYFPRPGREIVPPPMFNEENLNRLLEQGQYLFILDRACAQYEPDSPDYIRVTRATYSQIDKKEDFDILWSTRHYGPMVLYLTMEKSVDRLIKHLLVNLRIEDVADLVQLYNFVHHGSSLTEEVADPVALLSVYMERDSLKRHLLELALQGYQEVVRQREEQQSRTAVS